MLLLIATCIAAGTVVEKLWDSETAQDKVYTSWWMCLLWAIMTACGLMHCWKAKMWRRPALLLLHLSFVVILVGALLTHITSSHGYIHLRTKEATNVFMLPDRKVKMLPFYLCLDSFKVVRDAGTSDPSDYVSHTMMRSTEGDEYLSISMNHPASKAGFHIYQTSFDDDLQGSIFTVMYDPWGTRITYLGYALLALGMMLVLCRRYRMSRGKDGKKLAMLLLGGLLFASYMVIPLLGKPLLPVLRSPMLFIHVGVIMLSYCLLVVSFFRPALLTAAVCSLAAGIFLGAVWANMSWGCYWNWDPKEAWAIVTLIVYSIPLHQNSLPWFRSTKHYRLYSCIAFLCLLITYFGVSYFMPGMHSYL